MSLLSPRRFGRFAPSTAAAAMAVACSVTLAGGLAVSLPVQLASTAISIQGTGGGNATSLHGILEDWPYTHYGVTQEINDKYPASVFFMGDSVNQGANNLTTLLNTTPGDVVVITDSQGSVAATVALQRYVADPSTAPSPKGKVLVLVANPDKPGNGMLAQMPGFYNPLVQLRYPGPTPENSPYTIVEVDREYDGFADEPNNHANLLADANALMGIIVIHPYYGNVNMTDPNNEVKTVGNTTYYLIPTQRLPILAPLYAVTDVVHLSNLVDQLDPPLRAIINSAYNRSGYQTQGSLQQQQPATAAKPVVPSAAATTTAAAVTTKPQTPVTPQVTTPHTQPSSPSTPDKTNAAPDTTASAPTSEKNVPHSLPSQPQKPSVATASDDTSKPTNDPVPAPKQPAPKQSEPTKPNGPVTATAVHVPAPHNASAQDSHPTADAPTAHHDASPKPSHADSGSGHHGK